MAGITLRIPVIISQLIRNNQAISAVNQSRSLISAATTVSIQQRYSSFRSSKAVGDISEYPEVEVIKNPPEWKFVERLFPPEVVPTPVKRAEYPSGWRPQQPVTETQKYFVARTKNYMVPVYLQTKFRGLRRITIIRYIQGDIWSLEHELHKVIEASKGGRPVASRVNELSGQIHFHGDHVNLVKDWLVSKGF